MSDLTKKRIKIISITILVIILFIGSLFAYRYWFISNSIKATFKVINVSDSINEYGNYQYDIELYSIDDDLDIDIESDYYMSFSSDKKYEIGDKIKGYIKYRNNTEYIDFIPE